MMAERKVRGRFESETYVRWRAERIEDPVEKLSYLRQKMTDQPVSRTRPFWLRSLAGVLAAGGIMLLLPAHGVVSDVSPKVTRKHQFPDRNAAARPQSFRDVWLVDESPDFDIYSNGLRIDNTFMAPGQKRFYQVLDRKNDFAPLETWQSEPVGIVFHTTESHQAAFAAENNHNLKRISNGLLEGVRDRLSYNFLIDRFGRTFRVVDETSAANHAGNSVWADEQYAYVNLNNSFIGVAFEAQSGGPKLTDAQIHAGRTLTDLLRFKYKIPTTNCITHAQVSVNPSNMLIGYHTDWATDFPFDEMGLGDNYSLPPAAVADFGFQFDGEFEKAMGEEPWKGLAAAEKHFAEAAAKQSVPVAAYRALIHERYKKLYSTLKLTGALDESSGLKTVTTE